MFSIILFSLLHHILEIWLRPFITARLIATPQLLTQKQITIQSIMHYTKKFWWLNKLSLIYLSNNSFYIICLNIKFQSKKNKIQKFSFVILKIKYFKLHIPDINFSVLLTPPRSTIHWGSYSVVVFSCLKNIA